MVAVLGADSPIGLTVIRELGERGVPVCAVGRTAWSLGRYSRHATEFACSAEPLADWLAGFVAERPISAVLGISEGDLLQLSQCKGRLGETRVLCPDRDKLAVVLDKARTLEIAAGLGIAVPASWLPRAGEDFRARAVGLAYPVAVKWSDPGAIAASLAAHGLELEKVAYAGNPEELMAILGRYDRLRRWPLVQTWCPGYGLAQMLHMHEGAATLAFQHRRLREWPPSGGFSSFCEAIPADRHREQMALSEKLLAEIGWEGPAMVEYRFDPATRRFWLMEVNGRFWGSLPLAYHCGAHFAWEYYRHHARAGEVAVPAAQRQRKARYLAPDIKHLLAVLRGRDRGLGQKLRTALRFVADFADPRVRYYVWSLRDPAPLFGDVLATVTKRLRRERPGSAR